MLEKALVDLVSHMIRLKLLDNARFRGLFANLYVLEAKLVTPWGSAFSVASVPIKPLHDDNDGGKQDGEYQGFLRLVPILNAAFQNIGLCILGDSLYACAPLMKLCDDNGWDYVFTFKEGRRRRPAPTRRGRWRRSRRIQAHSSVIRRMASASSAVRFRGRRASRYRTDPTTGTRSAL